MVDRLKDDPPISMAENLSIVADVSLDGSLYSEENACAADLDGGNDCVVTLEIEAKG